jgi:hypothetical protein
VKFCFEAQVMNGSFWPNSEFQRSRKVTRIGENHASGQFARVQMVD